MAIVTPEYLTSDCHMEITLATQLNKTIVPLFFKNVSLPLGGPMALTLGSLVPIECEFGLTAEKLKKVIKTVADHVAKN